MHTTEGIQNNNSVLLVIDIQERLLPAIHETDQAPLVKNARIAIQAAQLFDVPVVVSEQYPRGLGPTLPALQEALESQAPFAKTEFSAYKNEALRSQLETHQRSHVILCGIEAHICVLQTALELSAAGYQVHLLSDAVASRVPTNKQVALNLLQSAGCHISSTETVAFQWCRHAGNPGFKALSHLVR